MDGELLAHSPWSVVHAWQPVHVGLEPLCYNVESLFVGLELSFQLLFFFRFHLIECLASWLLSLLTLVLRLLQPTLLLRLDDCF